MTKYGIRKILGLLFVMFMASLMTFTLIQLSPGDPAIMKLTARGVVPTEELVERTREEMGVNDPMTLQYIHWMTGVLKGDLGESYMHDRPVSELMTSRLSMTMRIAITAFLFLLFFSTICGIVSAATKDKWPDLLIRTIAMVEISIPNFWLGLMLVYFFIVKFQVFKLTDTASLKSILLPSITLALPLIGRYTRLIRGAVLEEIKSNYVTGAITRGVKHWRIWFSYILPNAMKKLITLFGMSAASLLGGTIIIESTFNWPGIGTLAIEAITYRDYPIIQGYVLLMAFVYVTFNLCADLLTQSIDPRLRGGHVNEG